MVVQVVLVGSVFELAMLPAVLQPGGLQGLELNKLSDLVSRHDTRIDITSLSASIASVEQTEHNEPEPRA